MAALEINSQSNRVVSPFTKARDRFFRHRAAVISLFFLIFLVIVAIFAPLFATHDPTKLADANFDLLNQYFQPPTKEHWLGTDDLGRDVYSRVVYGTRVEMLVMFLSAASAILIGALIGIIAGYFSGQPICLYRGPFSGINYKGLGVIGWVKFLIPLVVAAGVMYLFGSLILSLTRDNWTGFLAGEKTTGNMIGIFGSLVGASVFAWVFWSLFKGTLFADIDNLLSRFMEFISSIPDLPVLIVLSAIFADSSGPIGRLAHKLLGTQAPILTIVIVLVILGWVGSARLVRGSVLAVRELDYVSVARALGSSNWRIMFRHILPNVSGSLIVYSTLVMGGSVLGEAILSYLGFGIQEPASSWGLMLQKASQFIFSAPHILIAPSVLIILTILALNYVGDGLRDAFDVRG